jgi:hypothetical protein
MKRKRLSHVGVSSSGDEDDDDYDNFTASLTEEWRVKLVDEDETHRIVMESVQSIQPTGEMINPAPNAARLFKIETLANISTETMASICW